MLWLFLFHLMLDDYLVSMCVFVPGMVVFVVVLLVVICVMIVV